MPGTASPSAHPKKWLIAYNSISASLWSIVFFNTVFLGALLGQPHLFDKSSLILTIIQCCAVVEIVNSVTGVVKSPVFTTVSQVFSRLLIVLGIVQLLPDSPANYHWAYVTLTLSWSITEVVRYSYYAANLKDAGSVPYWLTWLRYSLFYVLYPTGVASEMTMIYKSLGQAKAVVGPWYSWLLVAILFTYPPGLYNLYTYMIKQRKKVLGSEKVSSHKKSQ
ncbi:PTPLA-domain-containing protein [Metschnikowia bicuspidata var. bicuspidata NRRL YB-4993]|uniref:Very-long-chain (3R)-3-hydroxyacyl-CoA dehydratase n=1 Tax=Metschnikowia bicuspidata var. bicuspidata NRRL YB-4993 TaxID=869754 RepID=A0A1A0HAP3_9ASCO|nr:PTPLA-domain-containing protein [Metschnikowia bicuspidata var. bicuspidata NRRL YB-4993]OBA21081.1 PTPLA-domain-containing protein [Metschnikowia bicuspidata var. bicuspidata NRRL YB-4993]